MNIALLTAAGTGTRMHQDIPKQFIHVDNKPIIIHTMEAFQNHPSIDAIIVVTLESWTEVLKAYAHQFNITKLKWVVPGGETGQDSIKNGLLTLQKELPNEDVVVLVHDGNRAMVSSEINPMSASPSMQARSSWRANAMHASARCSWNVCSKARRLVVSRWSGRMRRLSM